MKRKVLNIKTKVFVSKVETFHIILFLIFINISSKLELCKPPLDLKKFLELTCVYKTNPNNMSLSSWFQVIPQSVSLAFVSASGALLM